MNRISAAPLAFVAMIVAATCPPPARAQVCPWAMHAQVQLQVTWQHQMMMQNHQAMQMQQHMVHQQMMQQHLLNQVMALHAQHQAMHLHLATQAHQMLHHQALSQHLMALHHQQLTTHHQMTLWNIRWPWVHGHGGPYPLHPIIWRHTLEGDRTQHLVWANQFHRVAHLQRLTTAHHTAVHRTPTLVHNTAYLHQLARRQTPRTIPIHRQQYVQHQNQQVVQRHTPMVRARIQIGATCGHCHTSQPSLPAIALRPPSIPIKFQVGRSGPNMPAVARKPDVPMRPIVRPPGGQPVMEFVIRQPLIQPTVRVPVLTPLGLIPWRLPSPPMGTPVVAPSQPLAPIALLQPPALPLLIDKPLNLTPMPLVTRARSRPSPRSGGSTQPSRMAPEEATSSETSPLSSSSESKGTVMEMVVEIARGKPAARRRAGGDGTPLPDLVRKAPARPALETKYPVPALPRAEERPGRPASSRPSLLEVVLQPPQLPTLPDS